MGKGAYATTVKIGISWVDLRALVIATGGVTGADYGSLNNFPSGRDGAAAVVDAINQSGGIRGRRVVPVYHESPAQSLLTQSGRQQEEQATCAAFTEDTQVFAMIAWTSDQGVLADCAARADTPLVDITNLSVPVDERRFSEIGNWWYHPAWMTVKRRDEAYVAAMLRQRFLPSDAVIGLMTLDDPAIRRSTEKTLKPALAAAGFHVAEEATFHWDENDYSTYVLRFKAANVTHVLWSLEPAGGGVQFFMRQSETQSYRPRHFLSTEMLLDALASAAPESQLASASAVGWAPWADLGFQSLREPPINDGDARCRRALEDHGLKGDGNNYLRPYCDGLFLLQAGLSHAPALTSSGLAAGVESLGDSVSVSGTFRSRFGPRHHDGTDRLRDMAFDQRDGRFLYTSGLVSAPE